MKKILLALLVSMPGWVAASDLEVEQAWVRLVPPVSPNTAAYLMLHNNGKSDRVLVSATSDAASTVELHTVVERDGGMSMQRLPQVEIPAEDCVLFKPGANHIMFIGLKQPLKEGDMVKLTLQFKDGETMELSAPVKRSQGEEHKHHQH